MSAVRRAGGPTSRPYSTKTRTGAPLGQHFLVDERIQQKIVAAIDPTPEMAVLEIGAGPGNMTRLLAGKVGRLVSIEIDERWASRLRAEFAADDRVEIIHDDFLNVSLPEIVARAGGHKLLVFGNLPYYITSPILLRLFDFPHLIHRIVAMMQYEVAERLVAAPGEPSYSLLSVTAQFYTSPEILFRIPPGAFNPPPKVTSALVSILVRPRGDELGIANLADFWLWVRAAFAQKRKTLVNNWRALAPVEAVTGALSQEGMSAQIRAEDLSVSQFAQLYRALRQRPIDH